MEATMALAPSASAVDLVGSLVDKSLLWSLAPPAGESDVATLRFGMLETIREYGLERLAASGEEAEIRRRHAIYFLALAEARAPDLPDHGDERWLARMASEQGNLRLALAWLDDRGDAEALARLATALAEFWYVRGLYREGRAWLERTLARGVGAPPALRLRALLATGELTIFQVDTARAAALLPEALALARELGDDFRLGRALNLAGQLAYQQGDYGRAAALTEEALATFRRLADADVPTAAAAAAVALSNLGLVALAQDDLELAARRYEEAIAAHRAAGYAAALSASLLGLGGVAWRRGEVARAAALLAESLDLAWRLGVADRTARAISGLAGVAAASGQPAQAARLLGAAEAIGESLGPPVYWSDRPLYERCVAELRAALGEAALLAHRAEGGALAPEQAIAEARAVAAAATGAEPAPVSVPAAHAHLTPRELEVLRLLADGRSDKEIAAVLFISRRTTAHHVAAIFRKLGVTSRAAAAAFAVRHGLA